MPTLTKRGLLLLLISLCVAVVGGVAVTAQEDDTDDGVPPAAPGRPILDEVWVTAQDRSNLRAGPGLIWDVLTVLPPGETLRATGRTGDGDWIQVAFEGEIAEDVPDGVTIDGITYGWVRDFLLVWTGDVLTLPVDGVPTLSSARRSGPTITIDAETRVYRDGIDPDYRINLVSEPTEVELTGRIGSPSGGYHWLQFRFNGQYYWTATWEVGFVRSYRLLPDGSYVYAYGALLIELRQEIDDNSAVLGSIARRWRDLDQGFEVSCNNIPGPAGIADSSFRESDLQSEPVYLPPARALQDGIVNINTAIESFREVCSRTGEDRFVRPEEVSTALAEIDAADRNLTLARTLLGPLSVRDPLLGNLSGG